MSEWGWRGAKKRKGIEPSWLACDAYQVGNQVWQLAILVHAAPIILVVLCSPIKDIEEPIIVKEAHIRNCEIGKLACCDIAGKTEKVEMADAEVDFNHVVFQEFLEIPSERKEFGCFGSGSIKLVIEPG